MAADGRAEALAVAEAITAAFARKDVKAFADLYAYDATVWHNNDGLTQGREENLAFVASIVGLFEDIHYADIKRLYTDEGIIQQHVVKGVLADGRKMEVPACLIMRIVNGKIAHIDEYADPAPFHALLHN
ncbi:nuclear transport factor 2 family protein [Sphingobium chlorophenolicum]|uniref:SnoaL-like domain-containing protein n=1 Tax=Sphingobium chlorophenolicum TaxID=46429 RepID=A0A081RA12_SPHCR|nr:nuclear transport factor 2 family protein [Sphingobium chlorophenolicum]KEQ52035.1 hypothetical protein BV95_03719 [Sphingobium chlorophenolicum]